VPIPTNCPYGQPGDRLWVKETWRTALSLDDLSPMGIAEKCLDAGYSSPWAPLEYVADGQRNGSWRGWGDAVEKAGPGKTRVSIHMPRWASRITLEITGVRVERLQDIREADAQAEGIEPYQGHPGRFLSGHRPGLNFPSAIAAYRDLWEQINGPGSWDANPWVWVVTFHRLAVGGKQG
jgi:hypothetical protein